MATKNFSIIFILFECMVIKVDGGAFLEDKKCGTLYSESNFEGESFILKDFDQSVNLRRDNRNPIIGWHNTSSVRVEKGCLLVMCNETYFQGACHHLTGSNEHTVLKTPVRSVNCTCNRLDYNACVPTMQNCSCENIHLPMTEDFCGRAYLNEGGCNSCDAPYIQLYKHGFQQNLQNERNESVKTFVIRNGCSLELWHDKDSKNALKIINDTISTHRGKFNLYRCNCRNYKFNSSQHHAVAYPIVQLPSTKDKLLKLILKNDTAHANPGLHASFKSVKHLRSSQNAYILLIGASYRTFWGEKNLPLSEPALQFGEAKYPVDLSGIGVIDSSMNIIYVNVPNSGGGDNGTEDARLAASIEAYLSNHEELAGNIPNAVVIFHSPLRDTHVENANSSFLRKLNLVTSLRLHIHDELYSNLIVLLEAKFLPTNPEKNLDDYRRIIEEKSPFSNATVILRSSPDIDWGSKCPKINGYWKMGNNEYWPLNLVESLRRICQKGGDPLGDAIFNAAFPEEKLLKKQNVWGTNETLVSPKNVNLEYYRKLLGIPNPTGNVSDSFSKRRVRRIIFMLSRIKPKFPLVDVNNTDGQGELNFTNISSQNETSNSTVEQTKDVGSNSTKLSGSSKKLRKKHKKANKEQNIKEQPSLQNESISQQTEQTQPKTEPANPKVETPHPPIDPTNLFFEHNDQLAGHSSMFESAMQSVSNRKASGQDTHFAFGSHNLLLNGNSNSNKGHDTNSNTNKQTAVSNFDDNKSVESQQTKRLENMMKELLNEQQQYLEAKFNNVIAELNNKFNQVKQILETSLGKNKNSEKELKTENEQLKQDVSDLKRLVEMSN